MTDKDLIIGDWVCLNGDFEYECPMKVDGISIDDVSLEDEGFLGGIEDCIMPIPLTVEILKKNGFDSVKDGDVTTCWRQTDDDYGIEIYDITMYKKDDEEGFSSRITCNSIVNKYIKYVHQLQHALRMVELDFIANEFKVN